MQILGTKFLLISPIQLFIHTSIIQLFQYSFLRTSCFKRNINSNQPRIRFSVFKPYTTQLLQQPVVFQAELQLSGDFG